MSEKIYRHQTEIATRERALAMAKAAEELGDISVRVLANEGEPYTHVDSRRSGRETFGSGKTSSGTVPEGKVFVARSGMVPTNGEFSDRTRQIASELEAQYPKAA